MKKIILIFLAIAIILSGVSITAFADTKNSKITPALEKMLDNLSDEEKIETCVWLVFKYDQELVERETFKECGLTIGDVRTLEDVDLYKKTYNRILGELESAGNTALIEKTGVDNDDIVFCGTVSPIVILKLTKEQIYTISGYKEVEFLDYDPDYLSEGLPESDLAQEEPDPLWLPKLVREYYNDYNIADNDIKKDFCYEIYDVDHFIYVCKFSVDGYNYSDTIKETQIGDYILKSAEPQPLIIDSYTEKLYTFEKAYEKGIINDINLEDITKFIDVGLTKKNSSETNPEVAEPESTTPEVTEPESTTPSAVKTDPKEKPKKDYSDTAKKSTVKKNTKKKANPIKITAKKKTIKAKNLKKRNVITKPLAIKNAKGSVTVTKIKKGTTAKIYKKITINRKTGAITLKKGKYAKKTYKIKLKITAAGNADYKAKTVKKIVKIKVK